ncbi:HET-domain-containing protein [Xylariaceae sp. FL1651]|nr:HET-domain-containing protein [Xylariaceae sp. FL1651]
MWLINTETLRLEYFANPIKQSYAILSHTWGDEEVSFHQMADLKAARKMAGFAKIKTTCQLAKSRSLQYAWVDTCCIDKSSSAELSEAINSMFRWYEESTVCFAFLCDLTHSLEEPKCRWFRRGWTLQELLAPRSVLFYDASWRLVGDKAQGTFCHILSTITNIDYSVLKDCRHINSMPAGVRMSWAADRKTTRPEDTAYCMLGIFNISMPLLYGEGETAFIRLQEEICKQNNDMSLFAWTQQANSKLWAQYRGIFAFHPSEFLGLPEIDNTVGTRVCDTVPVCNPAIRIEFIS